MKGAGKTKEQSKINLSHFRVTMSEGMKKVEDLERRDKSFAKALSLTLENVVKGRRRKYRITEA